jgi:hypothetical protein
MSSADPIAAVRKHVDDVFKGVDLSGVTARVAHERCNAAIETLEAQCSLVRDFEKPRQAAVARARAERAAASAAEAARDAAAKQARIDRRRKALR